MNRKYKKKKKLNKNHSVIMLEPGELNKRKCMFPEKRQYEVWCEGFSIQGQSEKAWRVGSKLAQSFRSACHMLMCELYLKHVKEGNQEDNPNSYFNEERFDYDPTKLTYWGCRLYDNEEDARRSFG